jgi:hypothetical protein
MDNRVLLLINRVVDGAGEAIRTPSGVSPARLRSYAPKGPNGELDFFGNEVSSKHLRGR